MIEGKKVKLDFGCGLRPKEGFEGVDKRPNSYAEHILDLLKFPLPWRDSSVEGIRCEHFIEHIPAREIVAGDLISFGQLSRQDMIGQDMFLAFFDECHRILRPGGEIELVWPALQSSRAFKDPTHRRFVPMETMDYLNAEWRRSKNLSHYHVSCDFRIESQLPAQQRLWNVEQDFRVTLVARK
jgi:predicted SAM-dependent methyltransferase